MKFVKNPSPQRRAYEAGRDAGVFGYGYHNPFEGSHVGGHKAAWAAGFTDGAALRAKNPRAADDVLYGISTHERLCSGGF